MNDLVSDKTWDPAQTSDHSANCQVRWQRAESSKEPRTELYGKGLTSYLTRVFLFIGSSQKRCWADRVRNCDGRPSFTFLTPPPHHIYSPNSHMSQS